MSKVKNSEPPKGLEIDHDDLITQIEERSAEEYARGSDAAESGAKLKEYLEETGMNSQAFSWCKTILKKLPKKDGAIKAMDVIQSLKIALPMIENHVQGQQSTMDLDTAKEQAPDEDADKVTPFETADAIAG